MQDGAAQYRRWIAKGRVLFKPHELLETARGSPAAGAAVLTGGQWRGPMRQTLWHRIGLARRPFARQLAGAAAPFDLAEDIGSAQWFRGLATLAVLCGAAIAFWPDFSVRPGTTAMPLDARSREGFRVQVIQPLALGANAARRIVPGPAVVPIAGVPERPQITLTLTLGQGDSFARMLERGGALAGDAAQAERLVSGALGSEILAPGTRIAAVLGPRADSAAARPIERLALRARFDLDLAIARSDAGLTLQRRAIAVDATPLRIRGTVGTSLYRSARASGAPIEAIQQYLQTLDQHLSLDTAIEPGDTFDIVVAYRRSAGGEAQVGELLFAGLEQGGKPKAQLLRWGREGQFYEASGMGAQRTGLIMPVVGHITSTFGARRHPILGYTRMHAGVDFGAAYGSPIYAVGDGTVNFAGWHGGHGNYVRLDHGGGYATGYGHMSRLAVANGTRVRAGQVIGYVGSTGLSTGPHLHYELYRGGVPVNPLTVRFTVSNQVDSGELAAFRARIAQLKALKAGVALASLAPREAVAVISPLN